MPEMKTLNGYEVVDAKARKDIEGLQEAVENIDISKLDLSDYAKKAELPTKTSQLTNDNRFITLAEVPKTDLSNYALKASVPTKVSQLQNDSNFITRDEVQNPDLSEYAKKDEIPDVSDFITSIPSEYITESELNAKGYTTRTYVDSLGEELAAYVDDAEIRIEKNFPTKISHFTNDKGYLTSIPAEYVTESDLVDYATQDYVDTKIAANRVWVNQKGYATETFVTNKIAEAQLETDSDPIDLSGYATKDDINGFITEIPAEYITETELNRKGYLTEHQSLEGYATEQYVNDAIAGIDIPDPDLSEYAKKSDIPEIPDISTKADKEHTHSQYITSIPSEYVTESELNAKGYLTQHQSLAGLATTAEVLATSAEIAAVEARVDTLESDASKYLTSIPTEYITETELNNKNYVTSSAASAAYYSKTDGQANDADITEIKNTYATKAYVNDAVANAGGGSTVVIEDATVFTFDLTKANAPDAEKAVAKTLLNSLINRTTDFEKYILYVKMSTNKAICPVYKITYNTYPTAPTKDYNSLFLYYLETTVGASTATYFIEFRFSKSTGEFTYRFSQTETTAAEAMYWYEDTELFIPNYSELKSVTVVIKVGNNIGTFTMFALDGLSVVGFFDSDYVFSDPFGISSDGKLTWRVNSSTRTLSLIVDGSIYTNYTANGLYYN